MTPDLWTEIERLGRLNELRISDLRSVSVRKAEDEANYRKALAIAIMEERAKKTPVTIIKDICKGREDISTLRLLRDKAEAFENAYREEIQANKLRIRVLSEQLQREWGLGGKGSAY